LRHNLRKRRFKFNKYDILNMHFPFIIKFFLKILVMCITAILFLYNIFIDYLHNLMLVNYSIIVDILTFLNLM
jgi:hypothetical protein